MPKLLAPFVKDEFVQKITISDDGRHAYKANLEKREEIKHTIYVIDLTEEEMLRFLQCNQK